MSRVQDVQTEGRRLMVHTTGQDEVRPQVVETIVKSGGQVLSFGIKEASLEEVLLRVVEEGI